MKKIFFAITLMSWFLGLSCAVRNHSRLNSNISNTEWSKLVYARFDFETVKHKGICKDLESSAKKYMTFIKQSDFEKNLIVLDSLRKSNHIFSKNRKYVLINSYQEGFNFSECTSYLISKRGKKRFYGYESCNLFAYDFDTEKPEVLLSPKEINKKELQYYLALSTDCNLFGAFVITVLDSGLNIEDIHIAIMPSL